MSTFSQWSAAVEAAAAILKKRFPNLSVEETLGLSLELVKAVLEAHQ